jgi:3-methyladenine DNA glycosylase AlkD
MTSLVTLSSLEKKLFSLADPSFAKTYSSFFKTKKGDYAYGELFLGIRIPCLRSLVKDYTHLPLNDLTTLLNSDYHEYKFFAILVLCKKYLIAVTNNNSFKQKILVDFYLLHSKKINNWDLVDASAEKILGHFSFHNRFYRRYFSVLFNSSNLWDKRIAIVASHYFIKKRDFSIIFSLAREYCYNSSYSHDLLDKSLGWMLREVGKIDKSSLDSFLKNMLFILPRTTLRYAIEKHPKNERLWFLKQ